MSHTMGEHIRLTVFGQSHSPAIGAVIDGLPAGLPVDEQEVAAYLRRRAPGQADYATARKESDTPEFVSGLLNGHTCGAPLCAVIHNTDARSQDYEKMNTRPRPMHADYPAAVKFGGWHDGRGGGQFSGRLTAPLVLAGAVCQPLLRRYGVAVGAYISAVGGLSGQELDFEHITAEQLRQTAEQPFPTVTAADANRFRDCIAAARADGDSVGGIVTCCAVGLPVGLGEPPFDGLENRLAQAIFSIPAVKGVDFGAGFAASALRGSEHNDAFCMNDGRVQTTSDRHGGILGGLSTGMPLWLHVAFKPTPSIAKEQNTVDMAAGTDVKLTIGGRHDPCVVPRAAVCVEAAVALVLADFLVGDDGFGTGRTETAD